MNQPSMFETTTLQCSRYDDPHLIATVDAIGVNTSHLSAGLITGRSRKSQYTEYVRMYPHTYIAVLRRAHGTFSVYV